MRISYISIYNSSDVHNWSGLGHFIAKSLEEQDILMDYIGNLSAKPNYSLKLKSKLYKMLGKDFDFEREPFIVRQFSKQAKDLLNSETDVIFSPGTLPIAFLETGKPKVFYTDATFAGMINFYPAFSNFSSETIKHGNYIEQTALDTSRIAIYSSDWAARTAIDNYNIHPDKIRVVPFGANVEHNYELADIKKIVGARSSSECNIMFSGRDWERKGGDLAIEVVRKLNEQGLKTTLHLVGLATIPGHENLPEFVINHGFISKSSAEGRKKINALLKQSHFLILPTIADASPLALCEANSFGTPCITTNVGGISTIIKNDINGRMFSTDENADNYASYIFSVFSTGIDYQQLALDSFNEYTSRLNWKIAGASLKKILKEAL